VVEQARAIMAKRLARASADLHLPPPAIDEKRCERPLSKIVIWEHAAVPADEQPWGGDVDHAGYCAPMS